MIKVSLNAIWYCKGSGKEYFQQAFSEIIYKECLSLKLYA